MFPFFIVPMLSSRKYDPPPAPKCRRCGISNPVEVEGIDWAFWFWMAVIILGVILGVVTFLALIDWAISREYGPHKGEHFVHYFGVKLRYLWQMVKEIF